MVVVVAAVLAAAAGMLTEAEERPRRQGCGSAVGVVAGLDLNQLALDHWVNCEQHCSSPLRTGLQEM